LDYALPTASMTPELEILHRQTPSPVTPLGAKGVAEGNSMSTPVCIADGVADALGVAEVSLPLTPERVLEMVRRRGQ
jgi:2-furoyl-CoA dehydrogenase large subunit